MTYPLCLFLSTLWESLQALRSPQCHMPCLALPFQISRQIRSAPFHHVRQNRGSQGDRPGERCKPETICLCFMPSPSSQPGRERGAMVVGLPTLSHSAQSREPRLGVSRAGGMSCLAALPATACFVSRSSGMLVSRAAPCVELMRTRAGQPAHLKDSWVPS